MWHLVWKSTKWDKNKIKIRHTKWLMKCCVRLVLSLSPSTPSHFIEPIMSHFIECCSKMMNYDFHFGISTHYSDSFVECCVRSQRKKYSKIRSIFFYSQFIAAFHFLAFYSRFFSFSSLLIMIFKTTTPKLTKLYSHFNGFFFCTRF